MNPQSRHPDKVSENTFEKRCFASWIWVDIQDFLYNMVLRFYLEGSRIFLNLDLSKYKELEIGIWAGWLLNGAEKIKK